MRKQYGFNEAENPLFSFPSDLFRCLPLEILHTVLLGVCKYVLLETMSALSKTQKDEILARVKAFDTSGFHVKMYGNVCRQSKSFVGRDFKGWSHMAVFVMGPYLTEGYRKVLLTLSKVTQTL